MTPALFIDTYGNSIVKSTLGTPYLPSVSIAEAAIESAWNNSSLSAVYNNFYGIKKGNDWQGETVALATPRDPEPTSTFRAYSTPLQSFKDRNKFLADRPALYGRVAEGKTAQEQSDALGDSPFSGDPLYSSHIMQIINDHDLTVYDQKKK
jgi:flagellum-specific peptidoglycan hydrolase FlgJ